MLDVVLLAIVVSMKLSVRIIAVLLDLDAVHWMVRELVHTLDSLTLLGVSGKAVELNDMK